MSSVSARTITCSKTYTAAVLLLLPLRFAGAQSSTSVPVLRTTPAEVMRGVRLYREIGLTTDDGMSRVPVEQLDTAITERARTWVATLERSPVSGLQRDPMGGLYIRIGQDARAQAQFAARLATPGLSVPDKAYTLSLASRAFGSDATHGVRMQIALRYLAQLDALTLLPQYMHWRFWTHARIGESYYMIGDGPAAVTHIKAAFALMATVPFQYRNVDLESTFQQLADILSGQPNGRVQIDSIGTSLLALLQAPPDLVASDSVYYWNSQGKIRLFKAVLQRIAYLGRQAPGITAHYWVNTSRPTTPGPVPGTVMKTLRDGNIHVVEFGHMGCPGCLHALGELERMRKFTPSNVSWLYASSEVDTWGMAPCKPDDCVPHYTHFYTERKQIHGVTLALWIGPREAHPDGGTKQQESPTFDALHVMTQPMFIVTDGRGIIRHIEIGLHKELLTRSIQYLTAEAGRTASLP